MKLPTCEACGAVRAEDLALIAPCEQCGAPARETSLKAAEPEPGWGLADLGRRHRGPPRPKRPASPA